ncbi:MAG: helix-turn-helix transcriptional regulator [Oscillospiraceae bacterium]
MKELDYKTIGARLRKQRELLGYAREQLAEKLDVTPKFCSDIELGVRGMSLSTLSKMADILCMNTDYILYGDQDMSKTDTDTLFALVYHCPQKHRQNLITIIRAYVDAVSDK